MILSSLYYYNKKKLETSILTTNTFYNVIYLGHCNIFKNILLKERILIEILWRCPSKSFLKLK